MSIMAVAWYDKMAALNLIKEQPTVDEVSFKYSAEDPHQSFPK